MVGAGDEHAALLRLCRRAVVGVVSPLQLLMNLKVIGGSTGLRDVSGMCAVFLVVFPLQIITMVLSP